MVGAEMVEAETLAEVQGEVQGQVLGAEMVGVEMVTAEVVGTEVPGPTELEGFIPVPLLWTLLGTRRNQSAFASSGQRSLAMFHRQNRVPPARAGEQHDIRLLLGMLSEPSC